MIFSSRRWIHISIILMIGLVITSSGLAILYFDLNREHNQLQSEFEEVLLEVESFRTILDQTELGSSGSENLNGLSSQQIYDLAEPSVVKITVKVMRRFGLVPFSKGSGFI